MKKCSSMIIGTLETGGSEKLEMASEPTCSVALIMMGKMDSEKR